MIDNYARHEMHSFVECNANYYKILMDEEDAEKTTFITPWDVYHYRVMSLGLKNVCHLHENYDDHFSRHDP